MSTVFVIAGPSGVGKRTLIGGAQEQLPGLTVGLTATTRSPREGEREGQYYHFVDQMEFDRMVEAGELLEHATYASNSYGTMRSDVEAKMAAAIPVILEIELEGARQMRQTLPEAIHIFIAPPSFDDLRLRLEGRGTDDPAAITRRLAVAERELAARGEFDYEIINDNVQTAIDELVALIRSNLA